MRGLILQQQRASSAVHQTRLLQQHRCQLPCTVARQASKRQRIKAAERDQHAEACSTSYDRSNGDWDVDQFMQLLKERRQAGKMLAGLMAPQQQQHGFC